MKEIIDSLNYVVVAVDNDEEAAFIAMQVFDFAHRYRRDLSRFKIYVRLRDERNKRLIDNIAKYVTAIDGKETRIVEVFGTDKDVFAYLNLQKVMEEKAAKEFYYKYKMISTELEDKEDKKEKLLEIKNKSPENLWKERRKNLNTENVDVDEVTEITYKEDQDRSNVCHVYTKLALVGVADGEDKSRCAHLGTVTKRDDENNEYPQCAGTQR